MAHCCSSPFLSSQQCLIQKTAPSSSNHFLPFLKTIVSSFFLETSLFFSLSSGFPSYSEIYEYSSTKAQSMGLFSPLCILCMISLYWSKHHFCADDATLISLISALPLNSLPTDWTIHPTFSLVSLQILTQINK